MSVVSLCLGIFSLVLMVMGLIPCFGALNWFVIPLAIIGIVFSSLAYSNSETQQKGTAIAGLILCLVAFICGSIRLVLGGGII